MNKANEITGILKENIALHQAILGNDFILHQICEVCESIILTIKSGGKVIVCGNGGSATDAQHMVAEFVGRFERERKSLPAIDLVSTAATMTAIANDYSFEKVFARQIAGVGKKGDILIGISTSGNSKNIAEAFKHAREQGITTIALLGHEGGVLKTLSDIPLIIPYSVTARIQEVHATIIHIICSLVERSFVGEENE